MTRWEQIDAALDQALALPADERPAFLQALGDPDLAREVQQLLAALDRHDDYLEAPLADSIPDLAQRWNEDDGPQTDVLLGTMVGPYRIDGVLGRGGMGTVYRAERADGLFDQTVAVKVVRRGLDTDDVLRRFAHERRILASLHHPNIAQLYDGGVTDDGRPYFVMEHIEGVPLDAYCREHACPVEHRLRLFLTVCHAVHYAHQRLIVHRDLKPGNILVSADGTVSLLDFGIAKLLDDDDTAEPLTRAGVRYLSPTYAAPEQLAGEPVATWTDVYQLGLVLYELLADALPFEGDETAAQRLARLTAGTVPAPSARATDPDRARHLQGDLDHIVTMALRPEPARRYATAEQFANDVRRHLDGLPVLARGDSLGYRAKTFVRRHRTPVAAAVLVVLSLLAGLIGMTWQAGLLAEERDRARLEADKARQVRDFATGLFAVADARAYDFEQYPIAPVLARGAERIDAELTDQPAVQAEMRRVIGQAYVGMGQPRMAEPLLQRAVAWQRQDPDVDPVELAYSLHEYGIVLRRLGRYDDALQYMKEGLAVREAYFGGPDSLVALSLNTTGLIYWNKGDYEEAARWLERSLAMRRGLFGDVHPSVSESQNNLGLVLLYQGRYDEAAPHLLAALETRQTLLGPHTLTATSFNNVALLRWRQERYDEARDLLREAVRLNRRVLGDTHSKTAASLRNLAILLSLDTPHPETLPLLAEALAIREAAYGPTHQGIAEIKVYQARYESRFGDAPAADALFQEAIALQRATLGDAHRAIAESLRLLAAHHYRRGRPDDAVATARDARDMIVVLDGDGPPRRDRYRAEQTLGLLLLHTGRLDDARAPLQHSLDVITRNSPDGLPAQVPSVWGQAVLALHDADTAEARRLLDEGRTFCHTRLPDDHACHDEAALLELLVLRAEARPYDAARLNVLATDPALQHTRSLALAQAAATLGQ